MDKQEALKELRAKIDEAIEFAAQNELDGFAAMLCTIQGASFNPVIMSELRALMYEFTGKQVAKYPSLN